MMANQHCMLLRLSELLSCVVLLSVSANGRPDGQLPIVPHHLQTPGYRDHASPIPREIITKPTTTTHR